MSTNIQIDVVLRRLQEQSEQIKALNQEQRSEREEEAELAQKKAESERKERLAPADNSELTVNEPGQSPPTGEQLRQKEADSKSKALNSTDPDIARTKEEPAGFVAPSLNICHCYFYESRVDTPTFEGKRITVYSADGSSSAEAVVPLSIGLSIDLDLRPEEYIIKSGEYVSTKSGTYRLIFDGKRNIGPCIFNNPIFPPFDAVEPTPPTLNVNPDFYTGSFYSSLDIKQFVSPGDTVTTEGYVCLPVDKDVFVFAYITKSATYASQLVRYEVFRSEVTSYTTGSELQELSCRAEGIPTTVPTQTFLQGFSYGDVTVVANTEYEEETAEASEQESGSACFLVTPTSVELIDLPSSLRSALDRIFVDPPAASVTRDYGPFGGFTSTVTLITGFDPSYEETLGFSHGQASSLYSYNLGGDITIGGTPAAYYYLNNYEGGLDGVSDPLQVREIVPEAEYGANRNSFYSAEIIDVEGGYQLQWSERKIAEPTSETKVLAPEKVGAAAELIFNPPAGQLGFPNVAAASYGGKKSYCIDQAKALGINR